MKTIVTCLISVALFATFVSVSFAEAPPPFLMQWGSYGSGPGQFITPYGLDVGGGYVYVVDLALNRVQQFTMNGVFVRTWGSTGSGEGQFDSPWDVAVDQQGYVYVTDENNHRVQKFTSSGDYVMQWGTNGTNPWSFPAPHGVDVASDGTLFIVQGTNMGYLQRWSNTGGLAWYFSSGSELGTCALPNGKMAVSFPTCRIQVYLPSSEADFGSCGTGTDQMCEPENLASDEMNNIYVAERCNNRIHKFTWNGTHITMWGTEGAGNGEFSLPSGVAVDELGRVYVSDTGNHRIQVFGYTPIAVEPTSWSNMKTLFR